MSKSSDNGRVIMQTSNKPNPMIVNQAAEWVVRLDEGEISTAENHAFASWLLESPTHIEEFLIAGAMFNGCSSVDQHSQISIEDLLQDTCSEVIPLVRRAHDRDTAFESHSLRNRWKHFGLTASVALLITMGMVLSRMSEIWLGTEDKATVYSTEIGEQQTITLEDGSVILLNTLTSLETVFSPRYRNIYLNRGEAIFRVAKDMERPFRVFIDGMIFQAVGTDFNIYRKSDQTTVTVLHGKVSVRSNRNSMVGQESTFINPDGFRPMTDPTVARPGSSEHLLLAEGQQAVLYKTGLIETNHEADLEKAQSWRFKTLIFRAEALADVAQEFNRYNRGQIVIGDVELASLPISGVFKVDDPDSLVEFLVQSGMVVTDSSNENLIILSKARLIERRGP